MNHAPVLNAAQIWTGHNSHVQNGNVYGDVYNTRVYETDDRAEILKSLRYDGMDNYHNRRLDSYGDTYGWILQEQSGEQASSESRDVFAPDPDEAQSLPAREHRNRMASDLQAWLSLPKPMFWISGKPGSGKSTLMKFLAESEKTTRLLHRWGGEDVRIHSFHFWIAGSMLEKSQEGLMRSLLHQILQSQQDLIDHHALKSIRKQLCTTDYRLIWTAKELRKILMAILHDSAGTARYCFLIDGLDECSEDHVDLVDFLQELHDVGRVKICVSSRKWTIFSDVYGRPGAGLHIRLQDVNQVDIDSYIRGKFEEHSGFKSMLRTNGEAEDLLRDIRQRAQGVFLWVFLVTRELRAGLVKKDCISILRKRLGAMPPELSEYIDRMFDNIESYYKHTAARTTLLLNHCVQTGARFPLIWAFLVEQDIENPNFATDAPVQRLSSDQLQQYLENSQLSLQRWGQDVLSIVPSEEIEAVLREFADIALATTPPPHGLSMSIIYAHRSLFDYFEHKNLDGSLSRLAGEDYCPLLTLIRIMLRMIKAATFEPDRALDSARYLARCIPATMNRALAVEVTSLLFEIGRTWPRPRESDSWCSIRFCNPDDWPVLHGVERTVVHTSLVYMNFGCQLLVNETLAGPNLSKAAHYMLVESAIYPVLGIVDKELYPLANVSTLLTSLPRGQTIDVNEQLLRVSGEKQSLWQRYVSMLIRARVMSNLEEQYDPAYALELVKLLLQLGADIKAPVSLLKWSKDLRVYQCVACPAGLAFVAMDERDELSVSRSEEPSQSTDQVTCSGSWFRESFELTDQLTWHDFHQRVEQLLHEAYIASTSDAVTLSTSATDPNQLAASCRLSRAKRVKRTRQSTEGYMRRVF